MPTRPSVVALRARYRSEGRCRCGRPALEEGKVTCSDCLQDERARQRALYYRNGRKRLQVLKRDYGLTPLEAELLRYAQHYLCACCGHARPTEIDHDHAIGDGRKDAIRGMVCRRCNTLIGHVERGTWTGMAAINRADNPYVELLCVGRYLARPRPFARP